MPRARTVGRRIRQLVREGFPDGHGQAGAIAYRELREGKVRRNPALVKVKPIGSNMTEVHHGNVTVLYSYETPVAVEHNRLGFFRTEQFWSNTTSKHISKWLDGAKAQKIPQRDIEKIAEMGDIDEGVGETPAENPRERRDPVAAYPHPGKYEGEPWATVMLHEQEADEELGDVETFGYYLLYTGRRLGKHRDTYNAILREDSQGFVSSDFFDSAAQAKQAWSELEDEYSEFLEETGEE